MLSLDTPLFTGIYVRHHRAVGFQTDEAQSGDTMAKYNISFLCSECGRFHQTKISLTVIDGPDRVKRIDEAYKPSALPPEVAKLLRTYVMCPVTRNSIKLDEKELYLVPID
jgi:hypothetical protein